MKDKRDEVGTHPEGGWFRHIYVSSDTLLSAALPRHPGAALLHFYLFSDYLNELLRISSYPIR